MTRRPLDLPDLAPKPSERAICEAFYEWYLKSRNGFLIPCLLLHIANEFSGEYRPAFGAALKRMGKVSGALDYVCIPQAGRGDAFWIEMKSHKGKVDPDQEAFMAMLNTLGIRWYLARSTEEAIQVMRDQGICR